MSIWPHGRSTVAVARAAAVAAVLSGAPSTIHGVATGRPPLAAARAAGELLGRPTLARGAASHAVISAGWAGVLAMVVPRRHAVLWGGLAGLAIAELDLAIAGRWFPAIAGLPRAPQVADHVAFGLLVGLTLDR